MSGKRPKWLDDNSPGMKAVPPDVRDLRKFGRWDIERAIWKVLNQSVGKTRETLNDHRTAYNLSGAEATVSAILIHAIKNGDAARFEALLTRVIGKPKEAKEAPGPDPRQTVIVIPDNRRGDGPELQNPPKRQNNDGVPDAGSN